MATKATNGSAADHAVVQWDADMLMGKKPFPEATHGLPTSPSKKRLAFVRRASSKDTNRKVDPGLWGVPGHFTEEETEVFVSTERQIMRWGEVRR